MAKEKPGVMVYFEIMEYTDEFTKEQKSDLFDAILRYGKSKVEPCFTDPALKTIWKVIKPKIDKDDEAYIKKSDKAKKAAFERWNREQDNADAYERMQTHTNVCEQMLAMPTPSSPSTSSTTSPTTSPTTTSSSAGVDEDDDKRPGLFDEGFGELIRYYEDRINPTENQLNLDKLKPFYESMGLDCCKRAIDIAVSNNVYRINYVLSILRDKQKNGIKSIEAWDDHENRMKGENNNGRTGYGRRNDGLERTPEEILEEGARRWGIKL